MATRKFPEPASEFLQPGPNWATRNNTSIVLAAAIHAIASDSRTADDILANPSDEELERVTECAAEYIESGYFEPAEDGQYQWGTGGIIVL